MKFYPDKFIKLRKKERFTIKEICSRAKISRATLWGWESGKRAPSEQNIRMLAQIINQPIESISDFVADDENYSKGKLDEIVNSWLTLADCKSKKRHNEYSRLISGFKKLTTELSQASIIFNALQSSLGVIFYIKDINFKYITVSDSFLQNLGLNTDYNVKGKNDFDFFSKRSADINTKADMKVLSTGEEVINAEEIIPGSRNKKWGLVSRRPMLDSQGKIAGIVTVFVDITDRKKSEEDLALLKSSIDTTYHGILLWSSSGDKIYYYNYTTLESIFGYAKDEVYFCRNSILDFWLSMCVHPDDREKEKEYLRKGVWPKTRTYRIIRPAGEIRVLETTISKYFYNNEECHLSIITDITERNYAGEKIERLLGLIDKVDECIWMGNFDALNKFTLSYVSKGFEKMCGLSSKSLINNPNIWMEYVHSDYIPYVMEQRIRQLSKSTLKFSYEYKILHQKTGEERFIHDSVYIEDSWLFGISRDITERRKIDYDINKDKALQADQIAWFGEIDQNNCLIKMEYVNNVIYKITGISIEEFMSCNKNKDIWYDVIIDEDLKAYNEWDKLGMHEFRILNKLTGNIVKLRARNFIVGITKYGFIRDITLE